MPLLYSLTLFYYTTCVLHRNLTVKIVHEIELMRTYKAVEVIAGYI
jgi:hypothetical protein